MEKYDFESIAKKLQKPMTLLISISIFPLNSICARTLIEP